MTHPILNAIREEIRAIVRAELDAQTSQLAGPFTGENLPPGITTTAAFNRRCRTIPEAYPSGKGWACPRDAWERDARSRLDRRRRPRQGKPVVAPSAPSNVVSIAKLLNDGNARATR